MMPVSATQPSAWRAELSLQFAERAGRTALVRRAHRGPLIVQSPFYPEGPVCHVYVLHPPSGVAGGDHLSLEVGAVGDTQSLLTTPAAGKFYRCPDASAVQTVELDVARGASLEWLPQENIFFAGARVSLALKVALEDTARFIGWDINCLGRPSCNEAFDTGRVTNILELRRARLPALLERLSVRPGKPIADAQWGLRGQPVTATLVATPASSATLSLARSSLGAAAGLVGMTLLGDVLVCRYLGGATSEARRVLQTVWASIRLAVVGREPCVPLIWAT